MRRLHPVFNVVMLTAPPDPIARQYRIAPPPLELIDGEEEYVVEQILDSRMLWHRLQYLVKWEGYGIENNTWEYAETLDNATEAVADFHSTYLGAPHRICAMAFGMIPFHPVSPAFALSWCSTRRGVIVRGTPLRYASHHLRLHTLYHMNACHCVRMLICPHTAAEHLCWPCHLSTLFAPLSLFLFLFDVLLVFNHWLTLFHTLHILHCILDCLTGESPILFSLDLLLGVLYA